MNKAELMTVLGNPYLRYTEEELVLEMHFLEVRENHAMSTVQMKKEASAKRVLVYEISEVFGSVKALGLDTSGETAATILEKISGRSIGELQSSVGTSLALMADEVMGKTIESTKSGLNRFGSWLANKTQ